MLALVLTAVALRITTEGTPPLRIRTTLARFIRVPGRSPSLAWPAEGEAAVAVAGLGILGSSGSQTPAPIASVAKVMTAYLTLLRAPLARGQSGFRMRVTAAEVAEERQRAALGESILPVSPGETITERQALEALLVPSANNVAILLASRAGGIQAFLALMNVTARRLGMRSTRYTDPSGFDDSTVSTAADQLRLASVAMSEPALAEIVDERTVELPIAGEVSNYDGLVGTDGYVGVKTGSDRAAGGCLMFARRVTIAGRRLTILGVVLGQRDGSLVPVALHSAERLGDSAGAALRLDTLLAAGTQVLSASSPDAQQTTAVTSGALTVVAWGGLTLGVNVISRHAIDSVRAGEQLAKVFVGATHIATVDAIAQHSVGAPTLGWRLRHIL